MRVNTKPREVIHAPRWAERLPVPRSRQAGRASSADGHFRGLSAVALLIVFSPPGLILVPYNTWLTVFFSFLVPLVGCVPVCVHCCHCGVRTVGVLGTQAWNKA